MSHTPIAADQMPADSATSPEDQAVKDTEVTGGAFGSKGIGWAIFEWARNPYYNLIVIYVFTPFFAEYVIANGAQGQALVARTITIAGLIMAITAPILGAMVDKGGAKKPPIFIVLSILAVCSFSLWFIAPGDSLAIPMGMFLLAVAYCMYAVSELFHNAMLPGAGRSQSLPMISGLGLAMGNFAGVGLLIVMLILFQNPIFGLGDIPGGVARSSGPIVAIWLAVFIIPFFILMPDYYRKGQNWGSAFGGVFGSDQSGQAFSPFGPLKRGFHGVVNKFREYPNVMRYLVGRMIYADGIAAALTIGAVYVAGILKWSGTELTLYGILASLFAVLGGFFGGFLDQRLGPKRALIFELTVIFIIGIVQLSVTQESILFGLIPAGHTVWDGPVFTTLADVFYVALVIPAAIFMVACISSSRYMLVHIAPPERIGEFFGFYAMAGSVTVWLGPGLVDLLTSLSGNQRIGMAGISVLFLIGLIIIMTVKADKTPEHQKT